MSMPHCDTRSYLRQYVPVFARSHTSSYRPVMDMRSLLKALMALRDENAYALEERSGVPQATINRFLTGKHGDPRSTTVRKWAGAYNLTESQLRGDAPLPDALMREIVRTAPEYADDLLPSTNGESTEHRAQSPENNKGLVMQSNVVRLQREDAATEDGYVRMELLSPTPSAGRGKLVSEAPYVVRHLDVLESWARTTLGCADPSRVKLLTCVGDSMEGTIKDRDVVFVDLAQNCFTHPGIYVLSVGENLLVKRLDMTVTGDLDVISDNRDKYAPQRVHAADLDQVSIAGKVVGWWTLKTS